MGTISGLPPWDEDEGLLLQWALFERSDWTRQLWEYGKHAGDGCRASGRRMGDFQGAWTWDEAAAWVSGWHGFPFEREDGR